MKIIILLTLFVVFFFLLSPVPFVSAHVVVKPNNGGVGSFQTFTVSVPNEKEVVMTSIRLVLPKGLKHVSPNVKPGWSIEIAQSEENSEIEEIRWEGGSIPVGQRDDFMFSVQLPSEETTLVWKAYQTYQDGTIVSWDQTEEGDHSEESSNNGPASTTTVQNDLKQNDSNQRSETNRENNNNLPLIGSIIAIVLSSWSLYLHFSKK